MFALCLESLTQQDALLLPLPQAYVLPPHLVGLNDAYSEALHFAPGCPFGIPLATHAPVVEVPWLQRLAAEGYHHRLVRFHLARGPYISLPLTEQGGRGCHLYLVGRLAERLCGLDDPAEVGLVVVNTQGGVHAFGAKVCGFLCHRTQGEQQAQNAKKLFHADMILMCYLFFPAQNYIFFLIYGTFLPVLLSSWA